MSVKASVWVGRSTSVEALEAVLTSAASCDGDALGSEFSRAVGRPELADAVREVRRLATPTRSVAALLERLSFATQLCSALPTQLENECDTAVVFYVCEARAGRFERAEVTLTALQFLMTVS